MVEALVELEWHNADGTIKKMVGVPISQANQILHAAPSPSSATIPGGKMEHYHQRAGAVISDLATKCHGRVSFVDICNNLKAICKADGFPISSDMVSKVLANRDKVAPHLVDGWGSFEPSDPRGDEDRRRSFFEVKARE